MILDNHLGNEGNSVGVFLTRPVAGAGTSATSTPAPWPRLEPARAPSPGQAAYGWGWVADRLSYWHEDRPSSFEDVKGLTNAIASGLRNTPPGMACGYVMEIAPLKLFFAHRTGAHALTVWISGSGPEEETARRSLTFGLGLINDRLRGKVAQSS